MREARRAEEYMGELRQVAALYIDPRGPYPKMVGVDGFALTVCAQSNVTHLTCGYTAATVIV